MSRDRLVAYHEVSKHRLERYAPGPGYLDWATQPDPFRAYAGAPRVELPLCAEALGARYNDIRRGSLPAPVAVDRDSIGALFELSLGLSAWKAYRGASWALRCNPSSGNLHPTEGYVATGAVPGLERGLYHYASRDHALERRAVLHDGPSLAGGIVVGLASIYWREAWKYGIRAFRYCQHDCGHAIGAIAYAAAALGWRARLLGEPGDVEVARLLGLDRATDFGGAEREEPDCLVWVGAAESPPVATLTALGASAEWSGRANRLSPSHVEWREVDTVHAATTKPPLTGDGRLPPSAPPARVPQLDLSAAAIIRQRRSAVDFDGETAIGAEAFYAMLEPLVPHRSIPPWAGWPYAPRVHLALFVHRVVGLESGLYLLARDPDAVERLRRAMRPEWRWQRLGPDQLALYLLIAHDVRDAARTVSCHQNIAADSCFALAMLADFGCAVREPWRYRELHWECGMIGQVLYLEAEAAGIRATGIGCFFDDALHEVLGLPVGRDAPRDWQTLYHFTAGGAIDDPRLTTLPPYSFAPRARVPTASR